MGKKFSFNLPPVKVPSRHDAPRAKIVPVTSFSHTHTHSHSHRRALSAESISPPTLSSPFINRRPLSPKIEHDLRAACALILQDFKPSDHGLADVDPRLDFLGLTRPRGQTAGTTDAGAHRPAGAPSEHKSTHDARKRASRNENAARGHELPLRLKTARGRTETAQHADKTSVKSPRSEPASSAAVRADMDSDDGKSLATPLTGSTDAPPNNGSTAPTSAALTTGGNSKRASHQFESAAAAADAQASEWMRQELEKKRQKLASLPQPETKSSARPTSRSQSIKSGIKEYIFPGSAVVSRKQSMDSIRTTNSNLSSQKELRRTASSGGWRSWGLQRMSSSRSSSRPGTSRERIEHEQDNKQGVDLNRELPPLPSLDSWHQQEKAKAAEKGDSRQQAQGAHIATVMRAPESQQQQQQYAAAVRHHHRRSGSDSLPVRLTSYTQNPHLLGRTTSNMETPTAVVSRLSQQRVDNSLDFDKLMSATMTSDQNMDDQLHFNFGRDPQRQHSIDFESRASMQIGSDSGRLGPALNFSRKISADIASGQRTYVHETAYPNMVHITPPSNTARDESKSRLKKVFSAWILKKDKKTSWMSDFEKNGIKGGVMIPREEAALPPVVRY